MTKFRVKIPILVSEYFHHQMTMDLNNHHLRMKVEVLVVHLHHFPRQTIKKPWSSLLFKGENLSFFPVFGIYPKSHYHIQLDSEQSPCRVWTRDISGQLSPLTSLIGRKTVKLSITANEQIFVKTHTGMTHTLQAIQSV